MFRVFSLPLSRFFFPSPLFLSLPCDEFLPSGVRSNDRKRNGILEEEAAEERNKAQGSREMGREAVTVRKRNEMRGEERVKGRVTKKEGMKEKWAQKSRLRRRMVREREKGGGGRV